MTNTKVPHILLTQPATPYQKGTLQMHTRLIPINLLNVNKIPCNNNP